MKSLFITVLLFSTMLSVSAQTSKGDHFIGGTLEFSSTKTDYSASNSDSKGFAIGPSYGYFLGKNLAIGLSLFYGHYRQETIGKKFDNRGIFVDYEAELKSDFFYAGPFLRYYMDFSEKFKLFGQFSAYTGTTKLQDNSGNLTDRTTKSTSYGATLNPGLVFFPSKKWAIEMGFNLLSYSKTKYSDEIFTPKSTEEFSFGFNSASPSIGTRFHF